MNKKKTLIVVAVAFVLLLGGASVLYGVLSMNEVPEQAAVQGDPAGSEKVPAPDFTVYDLDGNAVRLSDHFGKPIVLNFWASWCGPCRSEMADFDDAYADLGGDVQFLMINMTSGRETLDAASSFVEEQGYSFPVFYDTESDAAAVYGISSLPTTVFIDADGYAAGQAIGAINRAALQQGIDQLLAE